MGALNYSNYLKYEKNLITLMEKAQQNKLEKSFTNWEICDSRKWSIAHEAALYGNLPKDFNQWELSDKNGQTVKDVFKSYNSKRS